MRTCLVLLLVLLLSPSAFADWKFVPDDYPTIQAGIDAADPHDTVIIASGTYSGDGNRNIDFKGKPIVLLSASGPESTIIDCEGSEGNPQRAFWFHSGEDAHSAIDGFTITGAYGKTWEYNAAILVDSSSSPRIYNCRIIGNDCSGIKSQLFSEPNVRWCEISDNTENGVVIAEMVWPPSSILLSRNLIRGNGGSGVYFYTVSQGEILHNTVVQNELDGFTFEEDPPKAGGEKSVDSLLMAYNIIAFNRHYGMWSHWSLWHTFRCNDVFGNSDGNVWYDTSSGTWVDNFSADPQFCDTLNGDFQLAASSPCMPENSPCNAWIGRYEIGCDPFTCCEIRGDANHDGELPLSISDIVYMIQWMFLGGAPPVCIDEVDINGSGGVDITDLIHLIDYAFGGGDPPAPCE